jgi:alkylation response protein AidB-like acyl-CoA dehydrogenase
MDFPLQPVSETGRSFVRLCEGHEQDFLSRSAGNDRESRFPKENTADLIGSGVMAATVPAELGGLGVVSMRDYCPGLNRLGRGDGSTAIATNMHLWRVWMAARAWRAARITGDKAQEETLGRFLREVASGHVVIAILSTETGAGILHPMAEAVRDGDGWRLSGRKAFATGSPVATHLGVRFRFKDAEGRYRSGSAFIDPHAGGVRALGNWDALGMRASGSHDVIFEDCFIPEGGVADGGPWGELTPGYMLASFTGVVGLAASFLGIAETAREIVLRQVASRGRGDRPAVQHLIAEMEIDLAAARAMLERSAAIMDTLLDAHPVSIPLDDLRSVVKDFQCAKHFVTRKAIDIVDRALTLSGGAGYMSASPLSRLYRDVRAGPFMQPFSQVEAFELIGKLALGLPV